jgi:hypothetical protein
VSTTNKLPADPAEAGSTSPLDTDDGGTGGGLRGWLHERRWLLIGAVVVGLLGGAVAAWISVRAAAAPTRSTPIELPVSMGGLPTMSSDPLHGADWQQKAMQAAAGAAWSARSYGHAGPAKTVRVVVARTDLTGTLEQAWAVGNGDQVGSDSCTHNTRITASSKPHLRPTVLVCWRTSPTLSAYALVIDPKATAPVPDADGADAVDIAWRAAGGAD